ncbi:MAG TPA: prepilin-type N-terminal cleavage/methylation domain-containing protein [Actinomycetes bacterium]|nr:prepilin-type N-terminal cleavage/methylation domain-containing protein [Actinomycetes bacterium]
MTMLHALRRRLHGDRGLTLVEMVVVTAILGVVLAMVQVTTVTAEKDVGSNATRLDEVQQAKVAMDSMSKNLRTSVLPSQLNGTCSGCDSAAFIAGDVRSVQFYANLNNNANVVGPSQVSYSVSSTGVLTEYVHGPNPHAATDYNYQYTCTAGTTGCVVYTRVLARHVVTSQVLFTYYDASGAPISPPLDATELPSVDSIDIVLKLQQTPAVAPVTLTERVALPNADAVAQASSS